MRKCPKSYMFNSTSCHEVNIVAVFFCLCLSLCFELLIFHILYLGSYSLFLGFYVAAHKWFVNPVLAIRPVCSLLLLLCHCWLMN